MERREFAKDIFLASLAVSVSPLLSAQTGDESISAC
jgi:hypothetical protein